MGRPPVLNSIQEKDICRRLAEGGPENSMRKVAKDYGVGEATIRRIFSAQIPKVRDVAQRLATAELDLSALPVSAQVSARSLADQLKSIQSKYAKAAEDGAEVAKILNSHALKAAQGLGDGTDDTAKLKSIAVLTETSRTAASLATNMITTNKGKESEQTKTLEEIITGQPR